MLLQIGHYYKKFPFFVLATLWWSECELSTCSSEGLLLFWVVFASLFFTDRGWGMSYSLHLFFILSRFRFVVLKAFRCSWVLLLYLFYCCCMNKTGSATTKLIHFQKKLLCNIKRMLLERHRDHIKVLKKYFHLCNITCCNQIYFFS